MSFLAPPTPASANRRMVQQAPVASNILGVPWPSLYGQRDLHGTVVAWTNHSFSSSGSTGKGGGQVSGGEKDFRTFALGLCIGPVDRLTQILYDNKIIWSGNVSVADVNSDGYVLLTSNDNRGTIAFYFGLATQNQDSVLAQFIPDVPFYRGMCYAVFHGSRTDTKGFRIGNADTLAQVSMRVTRTPAPPGSAVTFSVAIQDLLFDSHNSSIIRSADATNFAGQTAVTYRVTTRSSVPADNHTANIRIAVADGYDPAGLSGSGFIIDTVITSGTPFAVGSLGLMMTVSWDTSAPLATDIYLSGTGWKLQVTSSLISADGANVSSILYELLTSPVHGIALDTAFLDGAGFAAASDLTTNVGISYAVEQKDKAQQLVEDLLKNFQGALVISNGLMSPKLLIGGGNPVVTLESDDILGVRLRPGAWYELPSHVTVKFPDVNRKYRDTILSLPGAGDFGDDEKNIEIELPMITVGDSARLIGTRLRTIEMLPKTPDTITCSRNAFQLQFGDVVAINDPDRGFSADDSFVVIAVREHGAGDETIEIDIVPNVFGSLPSSSGGTGPGGGGGTLPSTPINRIDVQDAFELPYEWATDGAKRFTVFAVRSAPDAQGLSLFASIEIVPVDYDLVDSDAPFTAGGHLTGANLSPFTMARDAYIDLEASSDDIGVFSSLSDTDWFAYKLLLLIGSGDDASLYAAKELVFMGGSSWRVRGLVGPLSDTPAAVSTIGQDIWIFRLQPPYNVLAEPAWVIGSSLTFKAIPFGSRLSPTLADALEAGCTVLSRAIRPRAAVNLNANGCGAPLFPSYGGAGVGGNDIQLAWDLCNRGFGFGAETNPSEFDPSIACEVDACDVEIWVGGTLVRTASPSVRHNSAITSVASAADPSTFDVDDTTGLQPGDRIGVQHAGGEWFGRIASISGSTLTLVSPLALTPSPGNVVTRYEAVGYMYDSATNTADNGSLASEVLVKVFPKLNGLRALNAAEITVTKV